MRNGEAKRQTNAEEAVAAAAAIAMVEKPGELSETENTGWRCEEAFHNGAPLLQILLLAVLRSQLIIIYAKFLSHPLYANFMTVARGRMEDTLQSHNLIT
ncbi:unnamed protein product [Gongylonema pulchrum]|uniref:Uncharacterized protein n=1 Tax=Gongylonema pulchrum TaxID=637853 RepID=A0A183EM37_9BILA|nr:unnamed protein product [Gongylonema pulchrum]